MAEGFPPMKALLLLCLLAQPGEQAPPVDNLESSPFRQVITATMIQESGIMRLGEILILLEDWDYYTIDGLHGRYSASSLTPLRTDTWMVYIDGQHIDMNLLETKSLNLLPLALHDIDYIEVVSLPTFHQGTSATHGLFHIHTRSPEHGLGLKAGVWAGNETGDAGPYRYLDTALSDVEHIGPEYCLTLEGAFKRNWLRLSTITRNHPVADENLYDRTLRIGRELPTVKMTAPSLRAHFEAGGGSHDISAGFSDVHDYLFHRTYGAEIPAQTSFGWGGVSGSFPLRERGHLNYRLAYTLNRIEDWSQYVIHYGFDWKLYHYSANLEIEDRRKSHLRALGLNIEKNRADNLWWLNDRRDDLWARFYTIFRNIGSSTLTTDIDIFATVTEEKIAPGGTLSTRWSINKQHTLSGAISYTERLFEEDHGFWYWEYALYHVLTPVRVDYVAGPDNKARSSHMSTADLHFRSRFRSGLLLDLQLYHRRFHNLTLEEYDQQWAGLDVTRIGPLLLEKGVNGGVTGSALALQPPPISRFQSRFRIDYRFEPSGDRIIRDRWKSHPEFKFRGIIRYRPVPSFSITLIGLYRSPTEWIEYSEIDRITMGTFSKEIPETFNLDISVSKWFWQNRMRGSIAGRNLLNKRYSYHPIGAGFDLSLMVRMEFYLGTNNTRER